MLGSYGISSKQTYILSFTLVGKTQSNRLADQPDLVICSLFANFFQQKMSSIINVLPNINSAQLNHITQINLTSNQNNCSCFYRPISPLIFFYYLFKLLNIYLYLVSLKPLTYTTLHTLIIYAYTHC